MKNKKKSIVTGGLGFVGSHLAEKLVSLNHKVTIIDNFSNGKLENIKRFKRKVTIIKADISKKGVWQEKFRDNDYVFHFAALAEIVPSINNPSKYFDTNVKGTLNVLEASRKYNIKKFLYAASSSSYGIPKKYPTKENEILDPKYPYSLTKKLGEDLVLHWGNVFKLNVISLRFFNIYGERSRTNGNYGAMFGIFLAQKLKGKSFTVVGDGKQKRDFTYISDVISAITKAIKLKKSNIVLNIGSGKCFSINYIVKLLSGEIIYIPKRPGEPEVTWSNINRAKKLLNWRPRVSIESGVKILLYNIKSWKNAPLWNEKSIKRATKNWFKYLR